jgi:hypothetical protein
MTTYEALTVQGNRTSNHPDMNKPLVGLTCTCCGAYYKGRQYYNQDEGFSLGQCCVDFCKERSGDFEATYGAPGVHYNIDFALDKAVNFCKTVEQSTLVELKQQWTTDMSRAAQKCGWDIYQVSTPEGTSVRILKLDAAHSNNGRPVHPTDMHAWPWVLYGTQFHESQARKIMQTSYPDEWEKMLVWKAEREKHLKALSEKLNNVALGNGFDGATLKSALYELKALKQHARIASAIEAVEDALLGATFSHFNMQDAVVGFFLLSQGKFYEGANQWGDAQRFEKFITVAADSVKKLRLSDVERVLTGVVDGNVEGMTRQALGAWIKDQRPDLRGEVDDILEDMED